jgi:hypothetical protein
MKFSLLLAALSFSASAFAASGNNMSRPSSQFLRATKQVVGQRVDCVCGGQFHVGDRVQLLVNAPDGNTSLVTGQTGTVVSGAPGTPPLLVSWDNFQDGHNGNTLAQCPSTSLPDSSGWYVDCTDVQVIAGDTAGLGACLNNNGTNQTGAREAILQQPGVLTVVAPIGQDSCFNFDHPVSGKSYAITIHGDL